MAKDELEKTINVSKRVHKDLMKRKYDRDYSSIDKVLRDMIEDQGGFIDD